MTLRCIALPLPSVLDCPRPIREERVRSLISAAFATAPGSDDGEAERVVRAGAVRYGTAPFALGFPLALRPGRSWDDVVVVQHQGLLITAGLMVVARECFGNAPDQKAGEDFLRCESRLGRSALEQCAQMAGNRSSAASELLKHAFEEHARFYASERELGGRCLERGWPEGGLGYLADWAAAKCAALTGAAAAVYRIEFGTDPRSVIDCTNALFASVQVLDDVLDVYDDLASADFNLVLTFLALCGAVRLLGDATPKVGTRVTAVDNPSGDTMGGCSGLLNAAISAFRLTVSDRLIRADLEDSLTRFYRDTEWH